MSQDHKRVLIRGEYGTGKSILLQTKAESLAEKGEVLFVSYGLGYDTLDRQLYHEKLKYIQGQSNIHTQEKKQTHNFLRIFDREGLQRLQEVRT